MRGAGTEASEGFDDFVSALDTSMVVVTMSRRGRRAGCLVGFSTQCSIDPPRFVVCVSKANATSRVARRARYVGVHQLGAGQQDLARLFGEQSGDWTDKFDACRWHADVHDVPVLDDAPAWFVGRVVSRQGLGDHTALVLAPVSGGRRRDEPPFMMQAAKSLHAGHPA